MEDAIIIGGTAVACVLTLDLQQRLTFKQLVAAGVAHLVVGWIAALTMTASGPFPWPMGAAVGTGLLLTGVALLLPAVSRAQRDRRRHSGR